MINQSFGRSSTTYLVLGETQGPNHDENHEAWDCRWPKDSSEFAGGRRTISVALLTGVHCKLAQRAKTVLGGDCCERFHQLCNVWRMGMSDVSTQNRISRIHLRTESRCGNSAFFLPCLVFCQGGDQAKRAKWEKIQSVPYSFSAACCEGGGGLVSHVYSS